MEKLTWAEDLRPIGVYYEGVVDDATAVVERFTAETVTTLAQRDPSNSATLTGWQREHLRKEPG